jgi:hypothetical protein
VALATGCGPALAQDDDVDGVAIYVIPPAYRAYRAPAPGYVENGYAPRMYRPPPYYYRNGDAIARAPRRGGCGQYRYWSGEACVDARDAPPLND